MYLMVRRDTLSSDSKTGRVRAQIQFLQTHLASQMGLQKDGLH